MSLGYQNQLGVPESVSGVPPECAWGTRISLGYQNHFEVLLSQGFGVPESAWGTRIISLSKSWSSQIRWEFSSNFKLLPKHHVNALKHYKTHYEMVRTNYPMKSAASRNHLAHQVSQIRMWKNVGPSLPYKIWEVNGHGRVVLECFC